MPVLNDSLPKYWKHRASGQAVVSLSGVDVNLGLTARTQVLVCTIASSENGWPPPAASC